MKTGKLMWMVGIAALLVLPIVAAQSVLSSPWIYFGINTVILWGILYLLAKLLAKDLTKAENTGVHLALFGIAVVVSWNLVGGGGFIWKVGFFAPFFNMKFIVNTAFMTLILYYGLRIFGLRIDSVEGTAGMWILCTFVSGVIASSMNYYFWQAGTFNQIFTLLFGQYGILTMRESRLIIFVSMAVLLAWLFHDLKMGGDAQYGSKLNWAFSVIFAANLAADPNPLSVNTLIWIAYIIMMFIIARGMWRQSGV